MLPQFQSLDCSFTEDEKPRKTVGIPCAETSTCLGHI